MTSDSFYNNDKAVQGEVEYPVTDPASGAFFQADYKVIPNCKFPTVVKNVVSKNIEVKKLVYVYLVRYAEEQEDLALLSIGTFQRALKDSNQLIRAGALRVLSSIRVPMIVPIVMLAIRDSASDMSPYVRKTTAHAIPKLYSLDSELKEDLVDIIDKLLSDKAPLVVGSAAMAFTEVCPERMSLIHRSYIYSEQNWGGQFYVRVAPYVDRGRLAFPLLPTKYADLYVACRYITPPVF